MTIVSGAITFQNPVVGVIRKSQTLDETDLLFGFPDFAAAWSENPNRARGSMEGNDVVTIRSDSRTVEFTLQASGAGDEMRVLTAPAGKGAQSGPLVPSAVRLPSSNRGTKQKLNATLTESSHRADIPSAQQGDFASGEVIGEN